jgi:hypothetical protein
MSSVQEVFNYCGLLKHESEGASYSLLKPTDSLLTFRMQTRITYPQSRWLIFLVGAASWAICIIQRLCGDVLQAVWDLRWE